MLNLWKTFKDGVRRACDKVCGKKKSRKDRGDMCWWNEEVKDTIAKKKATFNTLTARGISTRPYFSFLYAEDV